MVRKKIINFAKVGLIKIKNDKYHMKKQPFEDVP